MQSISMQFTVSLFYLHVEYLNIQFFMFLPRIQAAVSYEQRHYRTLLSIYVALFQMCGYGITLCCHNFLCVEMDRFYFTFYVNHRCHSEGFSSLCFLFHFQYPHRTERCLRLALKCVCAPKASLLVHFDTLCRAGRIF